MTAQLLHLGREALLLALAVSSPPLAAALVVGLAVGLFQATTQIQEPSLATVARIAAVLAALLLAGPWMGARLVRFAGEALALAASASP